MKNTVKSLVLIWLTTFSLPVFAESLFATKEGLEKMYLSKKEGKVSSEKQSENYSFIYIQPTYLVSDEEKNEAVENKSLKENENVKSKDEDLPRLKRLYISGNIGYFYTGNDMSFEDSRNCTGLYQSPFFCKNDASNPMNVEYKDDYFMSFAFGINSANMFRLEFSYFALGKALEMEGLNQVEGVTQKYLSGLDLNGGSINLYFDLVGDRRRPYLIFVPYVMAGIGAAEISLDDITFTDEYSVSYTIAGKTQRNKTIVYGAGFSAGLNNYISLDIGYRYYDFGKIKTDVGISFGSSVQDLQLESDFKAHVVSVGLKLQI